jgi:HKD family nuclease
LIDSEYEIQGTLNVFPSKQYEFHSKEELDDIIGSINLYSSPYASMSGSWSLNRREDH